jgi:membrane protein DedA with SNARE-associated domain
MLEELSDQIRAAVDGLGSASIFVLVMLDNVGLPKTGEITMTIAAASGEPGLPVVFVLGALGAIAGDNLSYWIGRGVGAPVVRRLMEPARRSRIEGFAGRNAPLLLVVGRVGPIIRPELQLAAGAARLSYRRFVVWDAIGAVVWSGLWTLVGRLVGRTVDVADLLETIDAYALLGLLAMLLFGGVLAVLRWRSSGPSRDSDRHEDGRPKPS